MTGWAAKTSRRVAEPDEANLRGCEQPLFQAGNEMLTPANNRRKVHTLLTSSAEGERGATAYHGELVSRGWRVQ